MCQIKLILKYILEINILKPGHMPRMLAYLQSQFLGGRTGAWMSSRPGSST